jgi:hypothetical protein
MGYHAPSAEEVYRYIFRTDQRRHGGLTDGFSWSILFLNEASPECMKFLSKYGEDLCHRTADRIRFVFFSGCDEQEMQRLAELANTRGGGFLAKMFSTMGEWTTVRRRYDWERNPWDGFRPEAFHPLDSRDRISRHLSMECELHSAMPGSEEALRLAQKLGIGRFVPCFLMFSDIGEPTVRLFPVANKPPEHVFARLRSWIDSFYEVNNSTIQRWAEIEKRITEECRSCQTPIQLVDSWKRERQERWQSLLRLSKYLTQLVQSAPNADVLEAITRDWNLPWKTRGLVEPFLERLKETGRLTALADELKRFVDQMRDETIDENLQYSRFLKCRERARGKLSRTIDGLLDKAKEVLEPAKPIPTPESQIWNWWRSEFGRPISRRRYDRLRSGWAEYSRSKNGATAIGHVADILKEEFEVVQHTAFAQSVSAAPQETADKTIKQLALHIGVPPNDASWNNSISACRNMLIDYFNNLKNHAPSWLIEMGGQLTPPLCWGDCVPLVEQRQTANLQQCLTLLPRLNTLTGELKGDQEVANAKAAAARQENQRRVVVGALTDSIDDWLASAKLVEADRQAVWQSLISTLAHARRELETTVLENANTDRSAPYPSKKISRKKVTDLLELLEDYDRAAASIKLPFETDREVLMVSLDASLPDATGIALEGLSSSPVSRAKAELANAVQAAERSFDEWNDVKTESSKWNPVGRLLEALGQTLPAARMNEVVGVNRIDNSLCEWGAGRSRTEVLRLLDFLGVQELLALERKLCDPNSAGTRTAAATKEGLYDTILVGIGLLPSSTQGICDVPESLSTSKLETLKEKVKQGVFDVFLAHNSQDEALVLRLGQQLRNYGVNPWIDVEQIPPGRWFQDIIQSAIRSVKAAVIVIGIAGVGRWQAMELRTFVTRCVENGVPLIPVLLPGVPAIPDEWAFLREANFVKFTNDITEEEVITRLVWGITGEKVG